MCRELEKMDSGGAGRGGRDSTWDGIRTRKSDRGDCCHELPTEVHLQGKHTSWLQMRRTRMRLPLNARPCRPAMHRCAALVFVALSNVGGQAVSQGAVDPDDDEPRAGPATVITPEMQKKLDTEKVQNLKQRNIWADWTWLTNPNLCVLVLPKDLGTGIASSVKRGIVIIETIKGKCSSEFVYETRLNRRQGTPPQGQRLLVGIGDTDVQVPFMPSVPPPKMISWQEATDETLSDFRRRAASTGPLNGHP